MLYSIKSVSLITMLLYVALICLSTGTVPVSSRPTNWPTLKGAVYVNAPFLYINGSHYSGFSIDLLHQMTSKAHFHYSLFRSHNWVAQFGGTVEEIYRKKADFALGDLDDRKYLQNYLDVTEPIFTDDSLSAIVSLDLAKTLNLCSVEDLVPEGGGLGSALDIWAQGYHYVELLHQRAHPVTTRLRDAVLKNVNIERNLTQVLTMVKNQKIAYLVELNTAKYMVGNDCSYVILRDTARLLPRNIVMFMAKGSKYLSSFNGAIGQLKKDGTVDRLRDKYWQMGNCVSKTGCV